MIVVINPTLGCTTISTHGPIYTRLYVIFIALNVNLVGEEGQCLFQLAVNLTFSQVKIKFNNAKLSLQKFLWLRKNAFYPEFKLGFTLDTCYF